MGNLHHQLHIKHFVRSPLQVTAGNPISERGSHLATAPAGKAFPSPALSVTLASIPALLRRTTRPRSRAERLSSLCFKGFWGVGRGIIPESEWQDKAALIVLDVVHQRTKRPPDDGGRADPIAVRQSIQLLHLANLEADGDSLFFSSHLFNTMKDPQQSRNNLLADGALRCNPLPMISIRVLLSGEEMETLERVRALGFSSNAEVLRCATLTWADAAPQLPDESPRPLSAADSGDVCPASSSANL